jgi:uncharacterized membrane protein/uncharacterized membrane protein YbhN (UPF0104 family)
MKNELGISVLVLAAFFITKTIFNDIGQVTTAIISLKLEFLIQAIFFYNLYFYLRVFSWGLIVAALGKKLKKSDQAQVWFFSEAIRYIPGKIWSLIARVQITKNKGVPTKISMAAVVIEILVTVVVVCTLSIQTTLGYFENSDIRLDFVLLVTVIGLIITFIFLPKIRIKLDSDFNKIKNIEIAYKEFGMALLFQMAAWICFGLAVYSITANIAPNQNPIDIISLAVFSWLVGYLSFVVPSGLGVREGMMIVLLSQYMSPGQAATIALLARFIIILTEAGNICFWVIKKQKNLLNSIPGFLTSYWSHILLGIFIAIYVIAFSTLSILRHNAFASNYDLANMSQTVWNTINGRIFTLSGVSETISRFAIHADIILVFLSPFYLIWDKASMLLILQSLFLGLGAIPTYFLSQKVFKNRIISLIVAMTYLLNPAMQWTNIYDFHGVSLAIPFLLSAFYFAFVKNWRWYWLFTLLALTTKEQISLYISMIGLAVFFVFKERKIGLITFILGVSWFLAAVFLIIPSFSPTGEHWALSWYRSSSTGQDNLSLIPSIDTLITKFFQAGDIKDYYLNLLKPFAFLPLAGLPWLFLSLPELVINIMSSHAQMRTTVFHYDSGITPSLVIATVFGLDYIGKLLNVIKPVAKYKNWVLLVIVSSLLAISIRVNYHHSPLPTTPSCWCLIYQVSEEDKQFEKVIQTIPKNAVVTSSGEIRAHLVQREHSFNLPNATESADYIAILDESRIIGDYRPKEFEIKLIKVLDASPKHELIKHLGHFYLYKRKAYQP